MSSESFKSVPEQKPKNNLEKAFEGMAGSFANIYARNSVEYAHRIAAAEAGFPIKKDDLNLKKINFLKSERDVLRKASFKENLPEAEEAMKNFKIPTLNDFVKKDSNGKLLMKEDIIGLYKWSSSLSRLQNNGVRDFREAKNFTVNSVPEHQDRISFSTENDNPEERLTYDFSRLSLATLAESLDGGNEFTILPYPHTDEEGKIESKSLLVLSSEQRKKLRESILKYLQEQI